MTPRPKNRRAAHRCVKNVGMRCSYVNDRKSHLVTLRNFSDRGLYFESSGRMRPGALIVLRTMVDAERHDSERAFHMPLYSVAKEDPATCSLFRSHVVARVQRCVELPDPGGDLNYGVGAAIQILSDF